MHFKPVAIELFQWIGIMVVGFITATKGDFKDDIHRIVVTIVSMALGTLVSYYIKKMLNQKKSDMNFWDYFLGKKDVFGTRRFVPVNIFVWIATAILLGMLFNWIF